MLAPKTKLTGWIRKGAVIIRNRWRISITYKARVVVWALVDLLRIVMFPAIWIAAADGKSVGGYDAAGFITYFIGVYVVSSLVFVYFSDEIANKIKTGDLSVYLVKPIRFLPFINLMDFVAKLVKQLLLLPVLLLAIIPLRPYLLLPQHASTWTLVIAATALGFFLFMAFSNMLGMVVFWLEDNSAAGHLFWALIVVFSGGVAPLALLPGLLGTLATFLPFRYLSSFPIELYLERLTSQEIIFSFTSLVLWVMVASAGSAWMWRAGLRRYGAFGN